MRQYLPFQGAGFGGRQDPFAGLMPYRYQGEAGWDPMKLGPMEVPPLKGNRRMPEQAQAASAAKRAAQKDARRREFARLRTEEGLDVGQAAAALGVTLVTAKAYERERRQRDDT